jgi:hypothetical protein
MKIKQVIPVLAALAVVVTPVVASAATQSANTTINATINEVISISTSTTVTLNLTPTAGGVVSSSSDTVTVSTNKTNGYNLTLADADASANLVSGGNNITPHTGTFAAPTALTNGTWGYAIAGGAFDASYTAETNATTSTTKWAGVPVTGSPVTLKTTGSTASGDTTTVWYAAKANSSQPNGTYSDTVTYTATTN